MSLASLAKKVGEFAPLIGSVLGGPGGGKIGGLVASALGVENEPAAIEKAIASDPDAAVKLKELELEHKAELESLALETTRAELADKQDARKHHKDSIMPAVITVALTLLVGAVIYALFTTSLPDSSETILTMFLGVLIREWAGSLHYWTGTTKSSADKSKQLAARP